jgi:hypothetical protein
MNYPRPRRSPKESENAVRSHSSGSRAPAVSEPHRTPAPLPDSIRDPPDLRLLAKSSASTRRRGQLVTGGTLVCLVYLVYSVCFLYGRFQRELASGGPVCVRRRGRSLPPPSVGLSRASAERASLGAACWKIEAPPPCLRRAGRLPVRCKQTGGRQASGSEKRRHPVITYAPGNRGKASKNGQRHAGNGGAQPRVPL